MRNHSGNDQNMFDAFHSDLFTNTRQQLMTSLPLMYSTAILNQVNLFLRTLMRILHFLRTLKRVLRKKKKETVVPPLLLMLSDRRSQHAGTSCLLIQEYVLGGYMTVSIYAALPLSLLCQLSNHHSSRYHSATSDLDSDLPDEIVDKNLSQPGCPCQTRFVILLEAV